MPIEVRHDPNILLPMLASGLGAYTAQKAQLDAAHAQAQAEARQNQVNSAFGAVSDIGTAYFDATALKHAKAQEQQRELDLIHARQAPDRAHNYRMMMEQAGYQPDLEDPGYQTQITKLQDDRRKVNSMFDSGVIDIDQRDHALDILDQRIQSVEPPWRRPKPPPMVDITFDGQPIMQVPPGSSGFGTTPDGDKFYYSTRMTPSGPQSSIKPVDSSEPGGSKYEQERSESIRKRMEKKYQDILANDPGIDADAAAMMAQDQAEAEFDRLEMASTPEGRAAFQQQQKAEQARVLVQSAEQLIAGLGNVGSPQNWDFETKAATIPALEAKIEELRQAWDAEDSPIKALPDEEIREFLFWSKELQKMLRLANED